MDKNNLVVINLDRPRFLRFGHKALKQLSVLTGMSITKMNLTDFNLEDLEKILYCGLLTDARENGETLKLDDMEDLLDHADNIMEVMEKMMEALNKSFSMGGEGKEKN